MNNVTVLGIDLAKDVFQLHAINEQGKKIFGKKISRIELPRFIAESPITRKTLLTRRGPRQRIAPQRRIWKFFYMGREN